MLMNMFSDVVALGLAGAADEDVWSLDSRGILTLVVGKETYEALGLVGEALPWKEHEETHGMYRAHASDHSEKLTECRVQPSMSPFGAPVLTSTA